MTSPAPTPPDAALDAALDAIVDRHRRKLNDLFGTSAAVQTRRPHGMAAFDLYDAAHRVFRACLLELSEFALARTRHAGARFAPLEPALRAAAEGLIEDCTNQLRNSGIERVRDERDYLADFRREAADLLNGALAAGRQGTVDPRLFAGQGNRTMAVFAWLWPFLRVPLAILIAVLMFYWVLYGV